MEIFIAVGFWHPTTPISLSHISNIDVKVDAESTFTPDTGQHLSTNSFHSSKINQQLWEVSS